MKNLWMICTSFYFKNLAQIQMMCYDYITEREKHHGQKTRRKVKIARIRKCMVTGEILTSLEEGKDYFTVPTSQCNAGCGCKFIHKKALQWDVSKIVGTQKNGNPLYKISMKVPVKGNMVIHGITMNPQNWAAYTASLFRCSVKIEKNTVLVKTAWYCNLSGLRDRLCQILEASGCKTQEVSFQVEFSTYIKEDFSIPVLEEISSWLADNREGTISIFGRGFHGHAGNKNLQSDKNWLQVKKSIWTLRLVEFESPDQFLAILDLIIQTAKKIQTVKNPTTVVTKVIKLWEKAASQDTSPYYRSIKQGLNRQRAEEKFSKVRMEEEGDE